MRINIEVRDELHKKAKLCSLLSSTTLRDYIEKAIEEKLKEAGKKK